MDFDTFDFGGVEPAALKIARQALDAWRAGKVSATREALQKVVKMYQEDPAAFEFLVPFSAIGTRLSEELETIQPLDCRLGQQIIWARHREALLLETIVDTVGRVLLEGQSWRSSLRRYNTRVAQAFVKEARWIADSSSDLPFIIQQMDALGRLDLDEGMVAELSQARNELLRPSVVGEEIELSAADAKPVVNQSSGKFNWLKGKSAK